MVKLYLMLKKLLLHFVHIYHRKKNINKKTAIVINDYKKLFQKIC